MNRERRRTVRAHHGAVRRGKVLPAVIAVVLIGLLVLGALPRLRQSRDRQLERTASTAVPTVFTELVTRDTNGTALDVPASLAGIHETGIYARTNGFVKSLRVDLGSKVKAGDTLAVLDLPDIAEQLRQARASAEQVEATAALARSTLTRWRSMRESKAVTPQEVDEKEAAVNVADAAVRVARASVANLMEVARFGALIAPFAGVITSRSIDQGALVSSGAVTGNRPLMTLVQLDTVRAMLNVPQSAAMHVHVGQTATLLAHDLGNAAFTGRITLTASAIDPVTRTLLVELQVPNSDRRLLPGMYAHVSLRVAATGTGLRVPATALIIRADGPQVAAVDKGKAHLIKIVLGRDFGTTLEVLKGVTEGMALIVNPSEQLSDGASVNAIARGAKAPAHAP